ncbi:C-3 sterol dehydrogenase [Suillus spraguei]|nr:C-3 sterol dehydrogenase [Suillus spraguei]
MSQQKEVYLVIGGSGFVGRHIVEHLLARGTSSRHHDVDFYSGDIADESQLLDVLKKTGTTCIIHTASPPHGAKDPSIYYKVNVDGCKAVISAAQTAGVTKLVYTSSAGVVFDGGDVVNLDERAPFPEKPFDAYNDSKAQGEKLILEANGKGGLLTVALRPAGIFGEGDRQMMAGLYQAYQRGQTHFQVGDNNNLFDYTYVGNLAKAHLIAADKLPYVTPPPNAAEMEAAFNAPLDPHAPAHPIIRSRFDQFSDNAIDLAESSPLQVAGQVFFITNGEPMYFWDFMRVIWLALDPPSSKLPSGASERSQRSVWVIPRSFGMVLGFLSECWASLIGKEAGFTRYRYHNIEKARRVLGYEPEVGLEEGVKRMVEWFKKENNLP